MLWYRQRNTPAGKSCDLLHFFSGSLLPSPGAVLGASLVGGSAAAGVMGEPTWQKIFVDGEQVSMTAYNIGGSNFVKLWDIGKAVNFNVYWDIMVSRSTAMRGIAERFWPMAIPMDFAAT